MLYITIMNKAITAGKYSKTKGITIKQMSTVSGISPVTLDNWYKKKFLLFNVVIEGCKAKLKEDENGHSEIN